MSDLYDYYTAPDGSFTFLKEEIREGLKNYDFMDWDDWERGIPENSLDPQGNPIDRNNMNVKIWVMSTALLAGRFGVKGSAARADEYLTKYRYFEPLIVSMVETLESFKP